MKQLLFFTLSLTLFSSCKDDAINKKNNLNTIEHPKKEVTLINNKADLIINKAIEAHGGKLFTNANYSFEFRNKKYQFKHSNDEFLYTLNFLNPEKKTVVDSLYNGKFNRHIDGQLAELSDKNISKYSEAINSVMYFTLLPYKLNDKSVHKKIIGTETINNEDYDLIEVTFSEEGGGTDHDDQFLYWINKKTHNLDYLAYKYNVNGGGARFRSFYNRRVIGGITFQDYINWEGQTNVPLKSFSKQFEQNTLKELSRIETTQIINLK